MKKKTTVAVLLVGLPILGYWSWTTRVARPADSRRGEIIDGPAGPAEPHSDRVPKYTLTVPDQPAHVRVTLGEEQIDGFPKTVTVHVGDQSFSAEYTGSFVRVRSLYFVSLKLYSIASYLETPVNGDPDALLDGLLEDGPRKVYLLRFLRKLSGKQILNAINEEIEETFTDVDMDRFRSDIDRFVAQFAHGSAAGDLVYMAWLPGGHFFSSFNSPNGLDPIGHDVSLARAVWRIWAGPTAGDERYGLVRRFAATNGYK